MHNQIAGFKIWNNAVFLFGWWKQCNRIENVYCSEMVLSASIQSLLKAWPQSDWHYWKRGAIPIAIYPYKLFIYCFITPTRCGFYFLMPSPHKIGQFDFSESRHTQSIRAHTPKLGCTKCHWYCIRRFMSSAKIEWRFSYHFFFFTSLSFEFLIVAFARNSIEF